MEMRAEWLSEVEVTTGSDMLVYAMYSGSAFLGILYRMASPFCRRHDAQVTAPTPFLELTSEAERLATISVDAAVAMTINLLLLTIK